METVKYAEAEKYYSESFQLSSSNLEGIEYYSSCLWHLNQAATLCKVAQLALETSLFASPT